MSGSAAMSLPGKDWRGSLRLALAVGCSVYIIVGSPVVLDAGGVLGSVTMRDLTAVAIQRIFTALTDRSIEDESLEKLLNEGEWWKAAKNVVSRTRVMAILSSCNNPDAGNGLLAGCLIASIGAMGVHGPTMFTGTLLTDLAARSASPHRSIRSLSLLTAVLAGTCFLW